MTSTMINELNRRAETMNVLKTRLAGLGFAQVGSKILRNADYSIELDASGIDATHLLSTRSGTPIFSFNETSTVVDFVTRNSAR